MRALLSKAEKKRHQQRSRIRLYGAIGIVLLIFILFFTFITRASFFKIKSIEISGIVSLDLAKSEVSKNWESRLLGLDNLLSWPAETNGVSIKKDYSKGVLILQGPDAERFAIWCTTVGCFWVNRSGLTIMTAPDTEGSTIAKINDARNFTPIIAKEILDASQFRVIANLISGLKDLPITISVYSYAEATQELTVTPTRGAKLIFSTRFAPSDKLFFSLNNLITSGQIRASSYADFTVENRIYLK